MDELNILKKENEMLKRENNNLNQVNIYYGNIIRKALNHLFDKCYLQDEPIDKDLVHILEGHKDYGNK